MELVNSKASTRSLTAITHSNTPTVSILVLMATGCRTQVRTSWEISGRCTGHHTTTTHTILTTATTRTTRTMLTPKADERKI
mmetsp:Transcript_13754/g.26662  ORF Transcript_13754/g.26662 Transcript_13754/m.26662 type:complete len:82 (+) Transcript_13754:7460-7705(+)